MRNEDFADKPNRVPWPPLVLAGTIALGFLLGRLLPLPWPDGAAAPLLTWLGALLLAAGFALDLWAAATFRRARTTILPHRGATALLIGGPFAYSRNPIYLGNLLLISGAGLIFGELWHLLLVPAAAVLLQVLAIRREEAHLAAKFGAAWHAYAARTRRWL